VGVGADGTCDGDEAPHVGSPERDAVETLVRISGRALDRAGLVHAYGHCSARIDADRFLVSPRRPLGQVGPGEPCIEVEIDGEPPSAAAGEVRLHQAVYRIRSDVGAICRSQPPNVMTLSTARLTPRARHGFSSYFAPAPTLWDDPQLVREEATAARVAGALGGGRAIVLRGNGAVVVGVTIEEATVLSWFLEDSARVELAVRSMGEPDPKRTELTEAEARARATRDGGLFERMWQYLTRADPELDSPSNSRG
jgi:HCOMODA/2-hydroxy-3-carboxy-muconic semialdehyde decarboxylase